MSKLHGDDEELTENDAKIVKGMIARGDKNETIAAYFGVNQRAVSNIRSNKKFTDTQSAPLLELPPPGPYGVDPIYIRFYRTMSKVNQLWENRELGKAKALLEAALANPVFSTELGDMDEIFADMFRDEQGISSLGE